MQGRKHQSTNLRSWRHYEIQLLHRHKNEIIIYMYSCVSSKSALHSSHVEEVIISYRNICFIMLNSEPFSQKLWNMNQIMVESSSTLSVYNKLVKSSARRWRFLASFSSFSLALSNNSSNKSFKKEKQGIKFW